MSELKEMLGKNDEVYQIISDYEKYPKKLFEKLDTLSSQGEQNFA